TGKIWGATNAAGSWSARLLTPRATNQTTFGEDSAGEVYLATESGLFARIVDANPISPTVASVESPSGSVRGGEVVVVTGSGFLPGVVVTFGGAPGTDVTLLDSSSTRLSVVTPAHAAGTVDVVVTNSDGRSATLPGAYVFEPLGRVPPRSRAPRTVARQ
ncbi:MAG: IPT/TIG domain-containing protein, partial [Acidobacteriota bacterium]